MAHTINSYLLEAKQKLLGFKPAQLINGCATRWNTTYDMVCRAAEQQAAFAIMEKKLCRLELSTSDWSLMEQVRAVLKPFKTVTEKELIAIAEQKEGHGGNEAADCQHQDKTALSAMGDLFGDIYSQSTNTNCDRALRVRAETVLSTAGIVVDKKTLCTKSRKC